MQTLERKLTEAERGDLHNNYLEQIYVWLSQLHERASSSESPEIREWIAKIEEPPAPPWPNLYG